MSVLGYIAGISLAMYSVMWESMSWRLYHTECNPALWTGPQASTANYSYTLDFKAGIKMEGWW